MLSTIVTLTLAIRDWRLLRCNLQSLIAKMSKLFEHHSLIPVIVSLTSHSRAAVAVLYETFDEGTAFFLSKY